MSEQNAADVERVARSICEAKAIVNECGPKACRPLCPWCAASASAAIAAMKEAHAAAERWAAFGRAVMAQHKDGDCGDVDGGSIQEIGVRTGVLQIVEVKEPCAEEWCMCAEYLVDGPVDCYRVVTP